MFDFIQMQKKLLFLIAFLCVGFAYAQVTCPTLKGPFDVDIDLPVATAISWTPVVGAPSYPNSIGSTAEGSESINNRNTVECTNSEEFSLVSSEIATITSLDTSSLNGSFQMITRVTGKGEHEFALYNSDGPFQNSNVIAGLPPSSYSEYLKDKRCCGLVEENIIQDLTLEGFPNFFSSNEDGITECRPFIPIIDNQEINVGAIHIFDRHGNFIKQIDPLALGWDGRINGTPWPSSDYWLTAISQTTQKKDKRALCT